MVLNSIEPGNMIASFKWQQIRTIIKSRIISFDECLFCFVQDLLWCRHLLAQEVIDLELVFSRRMNPGLVGHRWVHDAASVVQSLS